MSDAMLRSRLLRAFVRGPEIRAIGGIVYDAKIEPVMSTSDLARIRHDVEKKDKIAIERQDAGGSPRWKWKIIK